jgi:hypothetical protein
MPTKREREYYAAGYRDGIRHGSTQALGGLYDEPTRREYTEGLVREARPKPRKRKLSAWNKYVKANSKKPRFRYRNGKLNLKKMAVAFRKTPAGRKKRR